MQDRPRRTMSSRDAAEAMFKAATTKPAEAPIPILKKPAVPGAKEQVSLRLDRDVLDLFPGGRAGLAGSHQRRAPQDRRQIDYAGHDPSTPSWRHSALMLAARMTLPPLIGFFGEERRERGGPAGDRHAAEARQPRLDRRIGQGGIDLLVEHLDDLGRRCLRCADAAHKACLSRGQSRPRCGIGSASGERVTQS